MDNNRLNESPESYTTGLQGLYMDFDGWVTRFSKCFQRSTYVCQEISTTKDTQNESTQISDAIFEDVFFSDILLRQRHKRRSARKPFFSFYKENDAFVFYDHVFYGIMNENGDRRIFCEYVRSKL